MLLLTGLKRLSMVICGSVALGLPSMLLAAKPAASVDAAAITQAAEALQPTWTKPLTIPEDDTTDRQRWEKIVSDYMKLPVDQVRAHPLAKDFPGDVPADAPRISRQFDFPLNLPRWQSTGLYAAPGEKITVRVSAADAGRGLAIVVGAHTDNCSKHVKWIRFPRVSRRFEITQTQTTVANAFGGLIYVDIPRNKNLGGYQFQTYGGYGWLDEHPSAVSGHVNVQINGAVEAPLYRLGQTSPQEWARMRQLAAPWGELAAGKIIFTFKTSMLASLDDPAPVLKFWDKVVDTEGDLAGWPQQPAPPERLVVDRDISAGFMHSGYPIMAFIKSTPDMIDYKTLSTKGNWGVFHELGHNHEGQAYTFGGDFVEVDVNLFSMFVMQKLVGREMTAHPSLKDIDKLLIQRLGSEKKVDAWTNLAMYVKTIQAFGWEPLHKTMQSYALPGGADGIKTREQKMDQWVLRYSKATGKNLAPYYAAFDVTCSDATKQAISSLPVWLPAGFPEKYTGK
jgi:hypothetical protein